MPNTQRQIRNKRNADIPRISIDILAQWLEHSPIKAGVGGSSPLYDAIDLKGSSFKQNEVGRLSYWQGCRTKVSKVDRGKTRNPGSEVGCSFPIGLLRLPVVGGLFSC